MNFWTKLTQKKGISDLRKLIDHHRILHINWICRIRWWFIIFLKSEIPLNFSFTNNFSFRNKFPKTKDTSGRKQKRSCSPLNSSYSNSKCQFSVETGNFDFLDKICLKRVAKMDTTIEFYIFELVFVSNSTLNKQFWIFRPNLPKKDIYGQKQKSEIHHGILQIWISLSTKFQLKLTNVSFWTKFSQKSYFQSKTEQAVKGLQAFPFCVVNVNSTAVFEHFEDLTNLNILKLLFLIIIFTHFERKISFLLDSFYLKIL